jgi:hypothetical protein
VHVATSVQNEVEKTVGTAIGQGGGGGRTPTQGATVYYQGTSWKVQYINSKGLVDLKPVHGSGEQHYGIDPAVLEGPPAAPTVQNEVEITVGTAIGQGGMVVRTPPRPAVVL